jgi:protein TonB
VIFDNTQQAGTDRRGAIAVLRFQAYAGSGRESRPLGFDDSERQQLSDNPPATSSASYSSFGPPPRPGMGATGGVSGGVAGGVWAGASSGAAPGAPGAPLRVGGGITPPRKIHDVKPRYPEEAVKNNVQGVVILEITVAEDGTVRHPRILRSIPMLDESAMEAVSQWQFEPPLLNGQPVPVIMTVTVAFAR